MKLWYVITQTYPNLNRIYGVGWTSVHIRELKNINQKKHGGNCVSLSQSRLTSVDKGVHTIIKFMYMDHDRGCYIATSCRLYNHCQSCDIIPGGEVLYRKSEASGCVELVYLKKCVICMRNLIKHCEIRMINTYHICIHSLPSTLD